MRILVVLIACLAGCSAPSPAEGPAEPLGAPLHEGMVFEGVNGTASRDGVYHVNCGTVTGGGQFMASSSPMTFTLPHNATRFTVTATWTAPHERLDFDVYAEGGSSGFGGTSPASADFFVDTFPGQTVEVRIALPSCQPPASFAHYDNVVADLAVTFA